MKTLQIHMLKIRLTGKMLRLPLLEPGSWPCYSRAVEQVQVLWGGGLTPCPMAWDSAGTTGMFLYVDSKHPELLQRPVPGPHSAAPHSASDQGETEVGGTLHVWNPQVLQQPGPYTALSALGVVAMAPLGLASSMGFLALCGVGYGHQDHIPGLAPGAPACSGETRGVSSPAGFISNQEGG